MSILDFLLCDAITTARIHKTRPQGGASGDLGSRTPPNAGKTSVPIQPASKHLFTGCWVWHHCLSLYCSLTIFLPIRACQWFQLVSQWSPMGNTWRFLLYPRRGAFLSPLDSEWPPGILSLDPSPFPFLTYLGTDQGTQRGWWTEVPFPATCELTH